MIAIVQSDRAPGSPVSYVALHLEPEARGRKVWVPIRGPHGAIIAPTREQALQLCVGALQRHVAPLLAQTRALYGQCSQPARRSTREERTRRHELAFEVSHRLTRLRDNLSRLLDPPTPHDEVVLDGMRLQDDDQPSLDDAELTARQLRAGRALVRMGVRELARAAQVSPASVSSFETGRNASPRLQTRRSLRQALVENGVDFGPHGWIRHRDEANPGPAPLILPCTRCDRAGDLVEAARRVLDQARAVLRYPPSAPEP